MILIFIIIIAAAILIFFAFSGGQSAPVPEIKDEKIQETVVNATVSNINIHENVLKRNHFLTYFIEFRCDDEVTREFEVSSELHDAVEIGERGQLVFAGELLIGFSNHGVVGTDSEPLPEDGFTHDDFDEAIDIEIDPAILNDTIDLDPDDQEYLLLFKDRKKLPQKTETIMDETVSLKEYSAVSLFQKITIYPFLKREESLRQMFSKTYDEAMSDLLGFEGSSRKGTAADSESVNRNEIRVLIKIQENPAPLVSRITAEFGVNE